MFPRSFCIFLEVPWMFLDVSKTFEVVRISIAFEIWKRDKKRDKIIEKAANDEC